MEIRVVLDCTDLDAVAAFWCAAAGYERLPDDLDAYASLVPTDPAPARPRLLLQRVPERKAGKNRLHLDLFPDDGPATVERLTGLGASAIGEPAEEFAERFGTWFQVMADPEGNEFCVVWRSAPAPWD